MLAISLSENTLRLRIDFSSSSEKQNTMNLFDVCLCVWLFYVHDKQLRSYRDGQLTYHTFPGQA